MKLHFRTLDYQKNAVAAVVDCFRGQPRHSGISYTIDKGRMVQTAMPQQSDWIGSDMRMPVSEVGFENAPLIDSTQLLTNIRAAQQRQGLVMSDRLIIADSDKGDKNLTTSPLNLDIEMETGTGKTYCYIRTMFELYKQYGWSKFIIVVPSIAIREGVKKSLNMMAEHFMAEYGQRLRSFIYDSRALHHLESFSANSGINVMVINVQAFNATGKDNRRIYDELDEFQSRRPIDVISRNRPILILDEPQKMQADKTLSSLANFNPLFILRYSATHKRQYNLIHRLDALDAYNQKLVKKISVKGIEIKGLQGTHGYLYLQDILVSKAAPVARLEMEIKTQSGFRRQIRKVKRGDRLSELSGGAQQYQGYQVSEIDARAGFIEFSNGVRLHLGEAQGDVDEQALRIIQIRETIRTHLIKEQQLYRQGIKVLSLFFIDEVAKYRQYNEAGQAVDGEYARIFKEEYNAAVQDYLDLNLENDAYQQYLQSIDTDKTHNGYFSVDKRSNRLTDPKLEARSEEKLSADKDAYDLILKDKERLLSFSEPTRFIFSHSALREGWDNPNIFVICTLKHSDSTISRRQEVGRGLRLAVNKHGERMDASYLGAADEIHRLNHLTVVANESYADFVKALQSEMVAGLASRPRQATVAFFMDKVLTLADGMTHTLNDTEARQINKYLTRHDYTDDYDHITQAYHDAKTAGTLAPLPDNLQPMQAPIIQLIDRLFDPKAVDDIIDDGRKSVPNPIRPEKLAHKEFQALWQRINKKAVYQIQIDTDRLITETLNEIRRLHAINHPFVNQLSYTIAEATQRDEVSHEALILADSFRDKRTRTAKLSIASDSQLTYDLIGEISKETGLTRRTVASILKGMPQTVFMLYRVNPEGFIREMVRIINQQQAQMVIQNLSYNLLDEHYEVNEIFTSNQLVSRDAIEGEKHVWQYIATDSAVERKFATALDAAAEVVVYAKLPDRFHIPTPFGNYNPDWAIVLEGSHARHIYFIAETKGSTDSSDLRQTEKQRIDSARKFFSLLNADVKGVAEVKPVQYDVVTDIDNLLLKIMNKEQA